MEIYIKEIRLSDVGSAFNFILEHEIHDIAYGIVLNGSVICIALCKVTPRYCEIFKIETLCEYRGEGYAQMLLSHIFRKYGKISVYCINKTSLNIVLNQALSSHSEFDITAYWEDYRRLGYPKYKNIHMNLTYRGGGDVVRR